MITAFVLIRVDAHRIPETVQKIADIPGVTEAYSCAGTIDLIAIVKTHTPEYLAEIVGTKIGKITGVNSTDTHLAFRSFSQQDIDACFSAGLTRSNDPGDAVDRQQAVAGRNRIAPVPPGNRTRRADQQEYAQQQRAYDQGTHPAQMNDHVRQTPNKPVPPGPQPDTERDLARR